jgi:hypothetical protein
MTAPTVDNEPSGPIPNDLLAEALTARAMSNKMDFGEPENADPAPDAAQTAAPDAPADPALAAEPQTEPTDPALDPPPAEAQAVDTDPFATLAKDAKPLTYNVNHTAKTFEGILEVEGKGAIIPAERLQEVRNALARSDSNADANRELYAAQQRIEQSFGGYDGIVQKLETSAQVNAAAMHIMDVLQRSRDAGGNIQMDAHSYALLVKEAGLAAKEAVWSMRAEQTQKQHEHATTEADAQVRETAIPTAIESFKSIHPTLTPEDLAAAQRHFGPFKDALTFKASPEQAAQWGVKPGAWMVDRNKMAAWFEDRVATRTATVTASTAQAAAAKFNAAAMPKPAPVKAKAKAVPRDADGKFVERERVNPSDAFERALSGRSISGRDFDE